MTAGLDQAVPSAASALTDRYGRITSVWYPWFVKILDFVNGIARGELIVDGAITAGKIDTQVFTAIYAAVDTLIANEIAALQITADQIDAANIDVLNGTFGTLQTNSGTSRVQITDASNELQVYVGGTKIASIGANVITNGAFITTTSPSAAWYPATFYNTSTTGGLAGDGGGSLVCQSVGGYTIQADQTTNQSGNFAGSFRNTTGGQGVIGAASGGGSYAFFAAAGTYGPFTGSHPALIPVGDAIDFGDIVVDAQILGRTVDDSFGIVARSSAPMQATALGAVSRRHAPTRPAYIAEDLWPTGYDQVVVNGVGEGAVNVCGEGGNIAAGDLIVTSSMPGKGMRQADDFVRSYTVARARESVTFASPTDVALIACIYTSG